MKKYFYLAIYILITVYASPCGSVIGGTTVKMVSIPAGSFSMGSTNGESDETPVHKVTLTGFQMGIYEVTQGQYMAIIGSNPSYFTGNDNYPVEKVSWWNAIKFCNALSVKEGLVKCYNETSGVCDFSKNGYRLPTETEWEYACRANTYYTGDIESDLDLVAWYNGINFTHVVGSKFPNAFGLYDMQGNVWEWCNDLYGRYLSKSAVNPIGAQTGSTRILRGGGWGDSAYDCRPAYRSYGTPGYVDHSLGFRVVRRP